LVCPTQPLRAGSEEKAQSLDPRIEKQNFFKGKKRKRTSFNPSTVLRSQRNAMRSSTETWRESQSSVRPRAHGLGHLLCSLWPRGRKAATNEAAAVRPVGRGTCGKQIISAAFGDRPREVDYTFQARKMLRPAHSRYGLNPGPRFSIGSSATTRGATLRRTGEAIQFPCCHSLHRRPGGPCFRGSDARFRS